jgi:hypothetical protein
VRPLRLFVTWCLGGKAPVFWLGRAATRLDRVYSCPAAGARESAISGFRESWTGQFAGLNISWERLSHPAGVLRRMSGLAEAGGRRDYRPVRSGRVRKPARCVRAGVVIEKGGESDAGCRGSREGARRRP